MPGFVDVFGGSTLQAAQVAYADVTLTTSIDTVWPPYATGAVQYLARIMDVHPQSAGLHVNLPDAELVSRGMDVFWVNHGLEAFEVRDYDDAVVTTVAPGEQRYLYLVDNSTQAGEWHVILMGVGAADVDAAQLAGLGVKAIGVTLNQSHLTSTINTNTAIGEADRARVYVNVGGAITVTPATTATLSNDFFFELRNQGTGALTFAPTGGELVDGSASIALNYNESCFVHAGTGAWYTVGRGRNPQFNFSQLLKTVTGGTDTLTLTEASNVVQTYSGVLTSNEIVVLPAVVQVYYISNQTTGAYSFTLQSPTPGATVLLPSGQNTVIFCDGINVINASTVTSLGVLPAGSAGAPSLALAAANNGLFAPSSTTVAVSANGTEVVRWDAGQTKAPNGTAGLPAYTFAATATAGMFAYGSGVGLTAGGVQRLVIGSTGVIGLGPDVLPLTERLRLSGDMAGAAVVYGFRLRPIAVLGTVASATVASSEMNTQAAAFTVATFRHWEATQGSIGAGSAVTNQVGFYADSNMTGAANNYGFYGAIPSGANRWNTYMVGTAPNYFAGVVVAGTTTVNASGAKLQTADGLTFPATAVPSSDPNTLDDYERGTFTPVLFGTTAAGVGTYTQQGGRYVKVGRDVWYTIALTWTAHTGTGNMRISGMPFPADTGGVYTAFVGVCYPQDISSLGDDANMMSDAYDALLYLYRNRASTTPVSVAIEAAGTLLLYGHYQTA